MAYIGEGTPPKLVDSDCVQFWVIPKT